MPGRLFTISIEASTKLSVGGGITTSLLRYTAATGNDARVKEISISGFGVSSSAEKMQVQLCRCSAAGTFTTIDFPKKWDTRSAAMAGTCGHTASGEPTVTDLGGGELDIPWQELVHIQQGITYRFSDLGLFVPASGIIALRVINGSTATSVIPRLVIEE